MTLKKFYKEKLKELATQLKKAKPLHRQIQSLSDKKASPEAIKKAQEEFLNLKIGHLMEARDEARYLHISYCLLRGRTIEQIESNPRIPHDESKRKAIEERMQKWFDLKIKETL